MPAGVLMEILRSVPADTPVDIGPIGDQESWDTEDSPPEPIVEIRLSDRLTLVGGGW